MASSIVTLAGAARTQQGAWISAFDHPTNSFPDWPARFQAINLAVIPGTSKVIAWDANGDNNLIDGPWPQRFTVGDPETEQFTNHVVGIPQGYGDLFCAGHVWLPDGRLFVAGGNTVYASGPACATTAYYRGSKFVGIWDPNAMNNGWSGWDAQFMNRLGGQGAPIAMHLERWYPTVTLISDTKVMVAGGVERTDNYYCSAPSSACPGTGLADRAMNTYEVFDLQAMDWERELSGQPPGPNNLPKLYDGPSPGPHPATNPCTRVLGEYPRLHLSSTNEVVMVGMFGGATKVRHDPLAVTQSWLFSAQTASFHGYGSSVLLPNVGNTPGGRDLILTFGGGYQIPNGTGGFTWHVHPDSRQIDGGASTAGTFVWGLSQTMVSPRMTANAVLLVNGDVLAIGGSSNHYFHSAPPTPVLACEVYNKVTGWTADATQVSPRMYHSTAALLPSGNVVSAGGDARTCDWEVYMPRYHTASTEAPSFAGTWAQPGVMQLAAWDTNYTVQHEELPPGITISRFVLMRPCSVTHHSDMDQRYVELEITDDGSSDQFLVRTPPAPVFTPTAPLSQRGLVQALPGHYMAFLISSQGAVSAAKWVRL